MVTQVPIHIASQLRRSAADTAVGGAQRSPLPLMGFKMAGFNETSQDTSPTRARKDSNPQPTG